MSRSAHIPALDGLRAVAIACVVLMHTWTYPATSGWINHIASAGWIGVDVFFVLSGFLITRILLASREQPDYYRRFYERRARRIFPAYYLLLAIVFLILPLHSHSPEVFAARHDWLYYVTYLANYRLADIGWKFLLLDITWSLSVEEQFYLIWPWIVRLCAPRTFRRVAWALILIVPLLRAGAYWGGLDTAWIDLGTPFRLDSFATGALLALGEREVRTFRRWQVGALLVVIATTLLLITTGHFGRRSALVLMFGHVWLNVGSYLVLRAALDPASRTARVLSNYPARMIGRISYGIYLYHPLTMALLTIVTSTMGLVLAHLTGYPLIDGALHVAIVSVASVVVAAMLYRWVELPWLRRRTSVTSPQPSITASPSPDIA